MGKDGPTGELTMIALYSKTAPEIIAAIQRCLPTQDEHVFGECAHAIGHLARRFQVFDKSLMKSLLIEVQRFPQSEHVKEAIVDMKEDVSHFIEKTSTADRRPQ